MRGRYIIIHYQMHIKYSIGSHLCTNIDMHGISFFFFKILFDYISAFQKETYRGFMIIITIIRVFHC